MARILVTCPQQSASAESYYRTVCPQVWHTCRDPPPPVLASRPSMTFILDPRVFE